MVRRKQIWTGISAAVVMLILILDAKTALSGAHAGLELCLRTVIPSLFPFIVICVVISSNLTGMPMHILRPVGKLCGMPVGTETLFMLGILSGYPVGAQSVYSAYKNGSISEHTAKRLLGFCSNAGPAFIFGMMGSLFHSTVAPWILWGIHILSAALVGFILPEKDNTACQLTQQPPTTVTQALEKGIKSISIICGWIVLFRVGIAFLERWFLWLLPKTVQICLIAALELSNGCCEMYDIINLGTRFMLCSGVLAFGGICVLMQTRSVTAELGWGMYFPGKVLQTIISVLLAAVTQKFIFQPTEHASISMQFHIILLLIGLAIITLITFRKKVVAFSDRLVYNNTKVLQS